MIDTTTCEECGLETERGAPCPRCLLGAGLADDAEILEALVGRTVEGKYRVEHLLGRGGMGAVYLATHLGTERPVALKVLAPDLMDDEEFVERFRREAKAAGRLRHPNIVNVTDFGVADLGDGSELAYLVMEYLDGESLADHVARRRERSFPWIADVVEQIAAAVDEAHRNGVIHRDLKPGNIWLVPNGRGHTVKVLDFGLAKLRSTGEEVAAPSVPDADATPTLAMADRPRRPGLWRSAVRRTGARPAATIPGAPPSETDGLTRFGTLLGTPHYMSPEQCRGERLDERSDVYSLGVMAYELLTGRPLFEGNAEALVTQHLERAPRPPSDARVTLPASVDGPVLAALEKRSEDRPRSAGAFARSLDVSLTASQENERSIFGQAFKIYGDNFWQLLLRSPFSGVVPCAVGVGLATLLVGTETFVWNLAIMLVFAFASFALGGIVNAAAITPIVARAAESDVPSVRWRNLPRYALTTLWPARGSVSFALWVVCIAAGLPSTNPEAHGMGLVWAFATWSLLTVGFLRMSITGTVALLEDGDVRTALRRASTLAKRVEAVYKTTYSSGETLLGMLTACVIAAAVAYTPPALASVPWGPASKALVVWTVIGVAFALVVNPILAVCSALKYVKARQLGGETFESDTPAAPLADRSLSPAAYWWERADPETSTWLEVETSRAWSFGAAAAVLIYLGAAARFYTLGISLDHLAGWWLVFLLVFFGLLVLWAAYLGRSAARTTVDDEAVTLQRPGGRAIRIPWRDATVATHTPATLKLRGPEGQIVLPLFAFARSNELTAYVAHQLRRHDKIL